MSKRTLRTISLFSGALGLDLGLAQADFAPAVVVECNPFAIDTIKKNRPEIKLIPRKIEGVTTREILQAAGLEPGEPAIVTAGPCCQAYSTAGQRGSMTDPRGVLFREFLRVVREARPRFFVMENVRGVLSAAIKHRPLKLRGPGYPSLRPDEELGSAFAVILKELKQTGYYTVFSVLNAADYGVPQARERVIIVGSRDGEPFKMPSPTHHKDGRDGLPRWLTLRQALKGLRDRIPAYTTLLKSKTRFLKLIPPGGNWRDLPPRLQQEALGAAYVSWGGRNGFYRRLAWDRPAPSLTTRPDGKATMLCHPDQLRPLSVREYARIQQFPDDWEFAGGTPQLYKQIGNAVPVGLGAAIGRALRKTMRRHNRVSPRKVVVCADAVLLERLGSRPTTILNPKRMRRIKSTERAKEWLNGASNGRGRMFHVLLPTDITHVPKRKRKSRPKHPHG
jgi:DNA (cytosine-5)-methyltransferase 1